MNRIFSTVWNVTLGQMVVASEFAKAGSRGRNVGAKIAASALLLLPLSALASDIEVALGTSIVSDETTATPQRQSILDANDGAAYFLANGGGGSDAGAYIDGVDAVAAGEAASAVGDGTTAVGAGSTAYASRATAVGSEALAMGESSTAVGGLLSVDYSAANPDSGVVLLQQTAATGLASTATGAGAQATGDFATANGAGAVGSGKSSVAIGGIADDLEDQIGSAFAGIQLKETLSSGRLSTAIGAGAQATESWSTAIGALSQASAARSIAVGYRAVASEYDALAVGDRAEAIGEFSNAFGSGARAQYDRTMALGSNSTAAGIGATAVGQAALALEQSSTALGSSSWAAGIGSIAIGDAMTWRGDFWGDTPVMFYNSVAIGTGADIYGSDSVAIGANAKVGNANFVDGSTSIINNAVALGANSVANRSNTVSVGAVGSERQITNVAAGEAATDAVNKAQLDSVAAGLGALSANAVVYDSSERDSLTLSGSGGATISNLKAGAISGDSLQAINGAQLYASLQSAVEIFGGGASLSSLGVISAPVYTIQGTDYSGLSKAFAAIDSQLSMFKGWGYGEGASGGPVAAGGSTPAIVGENTNAVAMGSSAVANGENGTAVGGGAYAHGPNDTALGGNANVAADGSTAVGANSSISAAATNAVAVGESASVTASSGTAVGQGASVTAEGAVALGQGSLADRSNTVSVGAAGNERQITNVASGTRDTDAANVAQVNRGINEAKSYTDSRFAAWDDNFESYKNNVDRRLGDVDRRMDRQGAMSAAMLNMATNAAGTRSDRGRIAVGAGFQSSEKALSIGYAKKIGERASFSFGGAFSGDESSAGIGFGIDL